MDVIASVNYLAVLVCGVVGMGFAYLWYSPFLFGKFWIDSAEHIEEDLKKEFKPFKTYGITFLAQFVTAYALAWIMVHTNATTISEGIRTAFLCWIGFTGTTMLINVLYEGKQLKLVLIDGGYHLIVQLTFGSILGIWQ